MKTTISKKKTTISKKKTTIFKKKTRYKTRAIDTYQNTEHC